MRASTSNEKPSLSARFFVAQLFIAQLFIAR